MTSQSPIRILGIAGSLREKSYNYALLLAARDLAPPDAEVHILDRAILAQIPPYNEDVRVQGEPAPVTALKEAIRQADALLFATPEYNFSIPGVLKNALDWASRPPEASPFSRKPVAIMGATAGTWGTVRAQTHLRQICHGLNMFPLNRPEVLVALAQEKFSEDGQLTDETARQLIRLLLERLVRWTLRLRKE
ncbi:MAG: NAD(P)H-dependent oxidoreductase [Anaerolineae bacterium]|nr:NAD(P)H-dependent oxidoreductase [Anaerolineae bacterium]MCX8067192.1 NAD(P)H-dependent oxidoreductase [Anaerolineae bacterium]